MLLGGFDLAKTRRVAAWITGEGAASRSLSDRHRKKEQSDFRSLSRSRSKRGSTIVDAASIKATRWPRRKTTITTAVGGRTRKRRTRSSPRSCASSRTSERRVAGHKSEKRRGSNLPPPIPPTTPDKAETAAKRATLASLRASKLETEVTPIPMPQEDRACRACGSADLRPIGKGKPSTLIEYVPAYFRRRVFQRETLSCRCGSIITAPRAAEGRREDAVRSKLRRASGRLQVQRLDPSVPAREGLQADRHSHLAQHDVRALPPRRGRAPAALQRGPRARPTCRRRACR